MKEEQLRDILQTWESIPLVIQHITEHPEEMNILLKIVLDDNQPENWRAAWLLDKVHEKQADLVEPFLPILTDFALQTKNSGKKRHLLKLISLHEIAEENLITLLNHCMTVFTDPNEAIAVRVHAMQILFNIASKEPELANEMIELIEHEIEFHGSAGISSRGRKLLAKLYKMNKKPGI